MPADQKAPGRRILPAKPDMLMIRINREAGTGFREDGYTTYRDYAIKQADEVLKAKHDWSIFEHKRPDLGKVDWIYMLRKSLGSQLSLDKLVS